MLGYFISFLIAMILFDGGKGVPFLLGGLVFSQLFIFKNQSPTRSYSFKGISADKFLFIGGLCFVLYFCLSSTWGLSAPSYTKMTQLLLLYLGGMLYVVLLPPPYVKPFSPLAVIGARAYGLLFILLILEVSLREFHLSLFHFYHPLKTNENFSLITKSGLFLILFFWPVFYYFTIVITKISHSIAASSWFLWKLTTLLVLCLTGLALCFHMDTTVVSLALSFAVFSFLLIFPRTFFSVLTGACLLPLTLPFLIPPLFSAIHQSSFFYKIPSSWQHRLYIWNFVSQRVWEKPLLGWGFEASRHLSHAPVSLEFSQNDFMYTLSGTDVLLPLHPHNGFLQIWLEGGIVAAVFFALFLWIFITKLSKTFSQPLCRAFIGASFLSCFVPFSMSYGVWQSWWIATLFLLIWYWRLLLVPKKPVAIS